MQASEDADGLKTALPALEPLLFLLSFDFSPEFLRTFYYYILDFYYFCFYNLLALRTLCSSSFIIMYSNMVFAKVLPTS